MINRQQLKTGGVIALLASTLAFSPSASAINLTVGNSVNNSNGFAANAGQSFINDPGGNGAVINLNTWTVAFNNSSNQTRAASNILTIYSGTGNGGIVIGTSSNTSTLTFASSPAATWIFTGGLQIIDKQTYTAVLTPFLDYRLTNSAEYPDGVLTVGTNPSPTQDLVFQGTFSSATPVTPVPFEFNPVIGLGILGGGWLLHKRFNNGK